MPLPVFMSSGESVADQCGRDSAHVTDGHGSSIRRRPRNRGETGEPNYLGSGGLGPSTGGSDFM